MTTEMQMMLFMSWMAKSCAVKGMKLLFTFFWTSAKRFVQTCSVCLSLSREGSISSHSCRSLSLSLRLSFSFQGHNWACSLQTGQRWRPRNGTLWWWWWRWWWRRRRLSALSQQWTQVMTIFFCIGQTCFSLFKIICFFVFRYGPPVRTEHRLIVENLSSRISWQVRFL